MSLRPNSRTEVRKKSYKTGVDADEARRRREDNMVEIRKNKREDNLLKKRREGMLLQSQQLPDAAQTPAAIEKRVLFFHSFALNLIDLWFFGLNCGHVYRKCGLLIWVLDICLFGSLILEISPDLSVIYQFQQWVCLD